MAEDAKLRAARALVRHIADHLGANLSIELWDGSVLPLGEGAASDIRIVVRSPAAVRAVALRPRLTTIFRLYAQGLVIIAGGTPKDVLDRWEHLKAVGLYRSLDKGLLARNLMPFLLPGGGRAEGDAAQDGSFAGAPRDEELIRFHYDVSNRFYAHVLDAQLVYSTGYFERPDMTLDEAQVAKLDLVCRKLRLRPGERLLDIGCGWGALICHAARHHGATCHGVTLSREQYDFAAARIAALGLGDRVTIELGDYRAVDRGEFDAVAQIEMFEHIPVERHDEHFQFVNRVLGPRGRYLHQATTRRATPDIARFDRQTGYQRAITRYIFPGGHLDHIGRTVTNLERNGFEVHDVENLREHYIRTLSMWLRNLSDNAQAAAAEAGPHRMRLWQLYFALFQLGFERSLCNVFQTLASKRRVGASGLPVTRDDLYA